MPTSTDPNEPLGSAGPEGAVDEAFVGLADRIVDDVLARHPELATDLGDHRFDDRLSDLRPEAIEDERRAVSGFRSELSALDHDALGATNLIDARILAARLDERLFDLDELREHEWDPLLTNPGEGLYPMLVREYAPPGDRLRSIARRLGAIPAYLEQARAVLGPMPRVHVETAIGQFGGTASLVTQEIDALLDQEPGLRAEIDAVRPAALAALEEHRGWLQASLDGSSRDPRIGPERFAAKLGHVLEAASDPDAILARAETDLERTEEEIAEAASRIAGEPASTPGLVRGVLDRIADDHPDDATVVRAAEEAFEATRSFVAEQGFVTLYDDPIEIIAMPEMRRGVAIAYCDPPGPLETAPLPTFFAISPTPSDWPPERVESFYREYNLHLLHDLTAHEAIPGHMLQLGHWRRFRAPTRVRAAFPSGTFIEGWACFAERLMVDHGYRDDRLQVARLKMELRGIINTILDVRVHAYGMTEAEAMRLMVERGHQEEGEAVGKWRRALLTSTQLSTYYVGEVEVTDLVRDLRAARPELSERQANDLVLSQGSPAVRHLRTLLLAP